MKIKIKKNKNTYKILFDSGYEIKTYEEVILKHNLIFKKEISDDLFYQIQKDNEYYEVYNSVIKLIDKKIRSTYEVRVYLEKKGIDDTNSIINQLTEKGLLNDYMFAKAFVNDKIVLSNDGPNKIRKELYKHKIDENIVNEFIDNIPKNIIEEKIKKIILKKKNTKYSTSIFKQKLTIYLVNLGYSREDIYKYLYLVKENKNISKNQMDKIYSKLSLKYSGDELKYKLKSKLYSKGYSLTEINSYIDSKQI